MTGSTADNDCDLSLRGHIRYGEGSMSPVLPYPVSHNLTLKTGKNILNSNPMFYWLLKSDRFKVNVCLLGRRDIAIEIKIISNNWPWPKGREGSLWLLA